MFPVFSFSEFDFGVVRLFKGVCYGFFVMLHYEGLVCWFDVRFGRLWALLWLLLVVDLVFGLGP